MNLARDICLGRTPFTEPGGPTAAQQVSRTDRLRNRRCARFRQASDKAVMPDGAHVRINRAPPWPDHRPGHGSCQRCAVDPHRRGVVPGGRGDVTGQGTLGLVVSAESGGVGE
ncbi:hypothetical protein ACFVTC_15460 [Streptomyces sp. NPDC057950]|uniref:hypothetical protein n=1 Tax=Streptomyces sp. NPDC057950 TaxID=3346288 RepID=UPI0036E893A5